MRGERPRADALDNRRRLVAAVGRLLATGEVVTLPRLAVEAGVSRATTYRNFADAGAAVAAYIDDFLDAFEQAMTSADRTVEPDGTAVEQMCACWGREVEQRSGALIHVRSPEGFLARIRRGDPVISRIDRIVRREIVGDARYRTLAGPRIDYAVFLWNLLLDPREVLDLARHLHLTVGEATARLTGELIGCLDRLVGDADRSGVP